MRDAVARHQVGHAVYAQGLADARDGEQHGISDEQWHELCHDISDRRELKWEWDKIDDDVKLQIRRAWSEILFPVALSPQPGPAQEPFQGSELDEASPRCDVCGMDTPHFHEPSVVEIERFIRPAFEKTIVPGRLFGRTGSSPDMPYRSERTQELWQHFISGWFASKARYDAKPAQPETRPASADGELWAKALQAYGVEHDHQKGLGAKEPLAEKWGVMAAGRVFLEEALAWPEQDEIIGAVNTFNNAGGVANTYEAMRQALGWLCANRRTDPLPAKEDAAVEPRELRAKVERLSRPVSDEECRAGLRFEAGVEWLSRGTVDALIRARTEEEQDDGTK